MRSTVLDFTSKNGLSHTNVVGYPPPPPPPTSTSHPPDVIHVMCVPRPSQFFAALQLPCIMLNANQRTKNGRGMGTGLAVAIAMGFLDIIVTWELIREL